MSNPTKDEAVGLERAAKPREVGRHRVTLRTASDGLPARVAPPWTEEKLMILTHYVKTFAKVCKQGWYGLDLFAGTGMNWSELREVAIPSSALIALEAGPTAATQVLLCEKNARARAALEQRVEQFGDRVRVFGGDSNDQVGAMLESVPRRAPAFAFLDPEGAEVAWSTVEAIAAHKRGHHRFKIEQLILFPTDLGFMRITGVSPESVTRIFGHEHWKAIDEARRVKEISADEARGQYVQLYGSGLRGLGYRHVLDREIKAPGGKRRYFLIFATDNDAGESIMDWCFNQRLRPAEVVQEPLFRTPEFEREKRLK